MSQNEKRLFDRHKKQEELPLEQTQAVPAVQDEITAEPAAEATPKRNKYADKMNRKKRRLSKGARIGITAAAVALPRMTDDWFWSRQMLLKRAQIK